MTAARPFAPLALCLAAGPALAGCPTGMDRVQGIVLAQNQPYFLRGDFQSTPWGFDELRIERRDGVRRGIAASYRHGLVIAREETPEGVTEFTYLDDLGPVETLPRDGEAVISGRVTGPEGDVPIELVLTFVGHDSMALAECRFDTWTVDTRVLVPDGAGPTYRVAYAPELDLVLAAREIGADGTLTPVYAYQWAGTAADVAR